MLKNRWVHSRFFLIGFEVDQVFRASDSSKTRDFENPTQLIFKKLPQIFCFHLGREKTRHILCIPVQCKKAGFLGKNVFKAKKKLLDTCGFLIWVLGKSTFLLIKNFRAFKVQNPRF